MRNMKTIIYSIVAITVTVVGFQNCAPSYEAADATADNSSNNVPGPGGGSVPTSTLPGGAPMAPSQLNGSIISAAEVELSWVDNSGNETGFRVERAPPGGPFSGGAQGAFVVVGTALQSDAAPGTVVKYRDKSALNAGSLYVYRVSAVNGNQASAATSSFSITTPPAPAAPPTPASGLVATPTAATVMSLTWVDNSTTETYFAIERSTGGGAFVRVAAASGNVTTFNDVNLPEQSTHSYRVIAVNAAGSANPTAVVAGTTLAPPANRATYAYVGPNVVTPNCVDCHNGNLRSGGVNLEGAAGARSIGGRLSTVLTRMPPGTPLSGVQQQQIQAWLNAGSPN